MFHYNEEDYDDEDDEELEEEQSEAKRQLTETILFQTLRMAIKRCEKIIITKVGGKVDLSIKQPDTSFGFEI